MRKVAYDRSQRFLRSVRHKPDDRCQIYFIQCGTTGLIKIGLATDIKSRLSCMQAGSPTILTVIASFGGVRQDEANLHERFIEQRHHGEWFNPAPELMAYIAEAQKAEARKYETIFFPHPMGGVTERV